MGGQIPQIPAVAVLIACKAPDQFPESLAVSELLHLDQRGILRLLRFPGEDRPQDCGERVLCRPGERCRDIHMQLARGMIAPAELFQSGHPLLILEEFRVALNSLAQLNGVVRPQLVHTHREQVCPELFAVQLQIQQPVVPDVRIADRVIDQIVGVRVLLGEQELGRKAVAAGELQELDAGERQLIQHGLKFPLLVIPEDDPPGIEILQRCGKPSL